ncbi:uncharacterized protein LOC117120834 [Anneissia japonica]|uniref:uncharacterized protein LOC117120834 n=1 Tax=Anneissia japonica TaxID=1529436 RepID=UPI001425ADA2|nr:uncharacterized protein LOC117120834 [Anneissia japonica]
MKTLMVTAVLLLVGLATAQRFSTTPKYFAPPAGGPNVNINDPNVNINDPNYAQPGNAVGAGGGQFSSYNPNGAGSYAGGVYTQVPALGAGGQSNSAETLNGGSQVAIDDNDASDVDANGSALNIDGTDGDSDASMAKGVNTTALGVVLTIVIVLGIFGVVAVILIRQRRQNSS